MATKKKAAKKAAKKSPAKKAAKKSAPVKRKPGNKQKPPGKRKKSDAVIVQAWERGESVECAPDTSND